MLADGDLWSGLFPNIISGLLSGAFAIIGLLVGLFVAPILRQRGRTHLHFLDWRFNFQTQDATGGPTRAKSPGEARWTEYRFVVEAYNTRDEPEGLRLIRVEFVRDGQTLLKVAPANKSEGGMLHVLNLVPKQWTRLSLGGGIWPHNLPEGRTLPDLAGCEVYFSAVTARGTTERHRIEQSADSSPPPGTLSPAPAATAGATAK